MTAAKKKKPSERARIAYRFEDGRALSQPLVETALACMRQWVAVENDAAASEEVRASARANLRKVAELAINAEIGLFSVREGGRKGGKGGSNSKAAAILAEADRRTTIGTGQLRAIASLTGASVRTVRDTLAKAGKYSAKKKSGK